MENERLSGSVVWFSDQRGYGYIRPDGWDKDIFVHYTGVNKEGFKNLKKDQKVEFSIGSNDKGICAVSVDAMEE